MNLLSLFTGGIGATVRGVSRGIATFTGDKVQREANVHDEAMAVHGAYAAENQQVRVSRTWWDSLVDGLNRLPRPFMALGVFGLLAWPVFDPISFAAAMQAYALVPEWLAAVFIAIVGFYFTTRGIEKVKSLKSNVSPEQVQQVLDTQDRIRALKPPANETLTDDAYTAALADTSKPMSNAAIERWNRMRTSR